MSKNLNHLNNPIDENINSFSKRDIIFENIDCNILLKKIENNSIDLVLIDPPYQISKKTNFMSGQKL